jgi:hypothetical protein
MGPEAGQQEIWILRCSLRECGDAASMLKAEFLVPDIAAENGHDNAREVRDLAGMPVYAEFRKHIVGKTNTNGPSLYDGHKIDEREKESRTMSGLRALCENE